MEINEIRDFTLEGLENLMGTTPYGCDIHHEIFNTDYYIIGTYEAEKWLDEVGTFGCIRKIQEYENFHFGEVTTDLSDPEKVVNMYVYIVGEEILGESDKLNQVWNERVEDDDINEIINDLT